MTTKTLVCTQGGYGFDHANFLVSWQDATARYHVWVQNDGTVDNVLYKNSIVDQYTIPDPTNPFARVYNADWFPCRKLDLDAVAHRGTKIEIHGMVNSDTLRNAYDAAAAVHAEKERQAEQARVAAYREAVVAEVAWLQHEGAINEAVLIRQAFEAMSDEQIRRFFVAAARALSVGHNAARAVGEALG